MFFRRFKALAGGPAVPALQKIIGLTIGLVMVWLVFDGDSPLNRGSKPQPPKPDAAQTAPEQSAPGQAAPEQPGPASPPRRAPNSPSPAIASTSPAITDSLVALGLSDHIVGRSPYCRSVGASVPVVGDLRSFDSERLGLAAPEVLFVQPPLAGVDPGLRAFCDGKSIKIVARRLESLADVDLLIDDIASVFGVEPNVGGTELQRALGNARASLALGAVPAEGARKVLLVVSAEPMLAVGTRTYLDELLAGANLANALGRDGYIELSAEALLAMAPETIIGVSETPEGARRIEEIVRRIPWKEGAAPKVAVDAVPELLSPSLAAIAHRGDLVRLAEAAK
ncbi:MAG: Vitamin B12-binding protein precursor [Planctomycetota bacterium]|jgi:ABC-type hemin transport system substrate-binding protein